MLFVRPKVLKYRGTAFGSNLGIIFSLNDEHWNINLGKGLADLSHEFFNLNKRTDRAQKIIDMGIVCIIFYELPCQIVHPDQMTEMIEAIQKLGKPG